MLLVYIHLTYPSSQKPCPWVAKQPEVTILNIRLSFLAVDDDPVFLAVLSQMMVELGFEQPQTVFSGTEAVALLRNKLTHFDCILLDVQMPGIDGIETCRQIRQLPHHRKTPIMMITTLRGRSYVDDAFAAGATDYLTKPLEKIELDARLGMMDRLATESRRAVALEHEMSSLSDLPGIGFSFEDAVPLPVSSPMIDYLALQNNLLTLGRLQLIGHWALAFKVADASQMFNQLTRIEYLDYMADIAKVLVSALKTQSFMLAHAGTGEFVCILNGKQQIDWQELEQNISVQLQMLRGNYDDLGIPIPVISIGTPQYAGIFSISMVKSMLDRARDAVRPTGVSTTGSRLTPGNRSL